MKIYGILIFFLLFCQIQLASQKYVTSTYGMTEGLNSPKLERIIQSQNGFIWVATNLGISSFDGYRYVNYSGNDSTQIGSVHAIAESEDGTIWFGSTEGLFFIKYGKIHPTPWLRSKNKDNSIQDILFDHQGNLWVASGKGPFQIHKKELKLAYNDFDCCDQIPSLSAWRELNLADQRTTQLAIAEDGTLFFANNFYLYKYENQTLTQLFRSPPGIISKINSIVPYNQDSILWSAGESYIFETVNEHSSPIFQKLKYPYKLVHNRNDLFVMTAFDLYKIEGSKNIKHIFNFKDSNVTYPRDLLIDYENNIWIASWSGLLKIRQSPFTNINENKYPSTKEVFAIHSISEDEFLLGVNHGWTYKLSSKNGLNIRPNKQVVLRSEIVDFQQDKNGHIWMATTYQGLVKKQSNQYINYTRSDGLADNGFHCLFKTKNNEIWAGGDGGITKIDVGDKYQSTFKNFTYPITDATYIQVLCGIDGPNNKLWLGTNLGVFQFDGDTLKPYPIIKNENPFVFDMVITDNNVVWLATNTLGLLKCDFSSTGDLRIIRQFTNDNKVYSNAYLDLLLDSKDRLWAASYDEICLINKHNLETETNIICFDKNDGFQLSGYHQIKMIEDPNGTIWAASSRGMVYFDPAEIIFNERPPSTHIHKILLDGEDVDLSPYAVDIDPNTNLPDKLILPAAKNYLSFDFSSISLSNPSKTNYQFQLEGVDKEWQNSSVNRIAHYPNLNPGSYTFQVKASNIHGIWNKTPKSIEINIRPPFWQTWWFIFGSGAIILSCIIFYFKRRETALRKTEAEKNRVNNLIAELKIKAIRAQMNPHFIFNCLNSIQACIVSQKQDVAVLYLSKFAKLLRMVLNYCENNLIELENEIEFLSLYLELEQLRFGNSLEYFIEVDEDSDMDNINIPSFLIQPFIENSIWHGLLHKPNDRKLWIRFTISENENKLLCEIEDNGIGREKSENLKLKKIKSIEHQSKGMRLSTDRLDLIKLKFPEDVSFSITDLKDDKQNPLGTRVNLSLPI